MADYYARLLKAGLRPRRRRRAARPRPPEREPTRSSLAKLLTDAGQARPGLRGLRVRVAAQDLRDTRRGGRRRCEDRVRRRRRLHHRRDDDLGGVVPLALRPRARRRGAAPRRSVRRRQWQAGRQRVPRRARPRGRDDDAGALPWLVDATISRFRMRELAHLGRSGPPAPGRAGPWRPRASYRRPATAAASIADRPPVRPRAASSRPEAGDLMASTISAACPRPRGRGTARRTGRREAGRQAEGLRRRVADRGIPGVRRG